MGGRLKRKIRSSRSKWTLQTKKKAYRARRWKRLLLRKLRHVIGRLGCLVIRVNREEEEWLIKIDITSYGYK